LQPSSDVPKDELAEVIDEGRNAAATHCAIFVTMFGAFLAKPTAAQSSCPLRNKKFNGNVYKTPYCGDAHSSCASIVFLSGMMKEGDSAAAGPSACSD
jgi:hypothetical protein